MNVIWRLFRMKFYLLQGGGRLSFGQNKAHIADQNAYLLCFQNFKIPCLRNLRVIYLYLCQKLVGRYLVLWPKCCDCLRHSKFSKFPKFANFPFQQKNESDQKLLKILQMSFWAAVTTKNKNLSWILNNHWLLIWYNTINYNTLLPL